MKRIAVLKSQFQVICLIGIGAASASATTLHFDELPFQPVDGLSIGGVTFGFEVGGASSPDAFYNFNSGIGQTAYLSPPRA